CYRACTSNIVRHPQRPERSCYLWSLTKRGGQRVDFGLHVGKRVAVIVAANNAPRPYQGRPERQVLMKERIGVDTIFEDHINLALPAGKISWAIAAQGNYIWNAGDIRSKGFNKKV